MIILEDSEQLVTETGDDIVMEDYVESGGVGNISVANNLTGEIVSYIGRVRVGGKKIEADKRITFE